MIQKAVRREPRLVRIHDCTVNKSGSSMHLTYLYMILMCLKERKQIQDEKQRKPTFDYSSSCVASSQSWTFSSCDAL